MNNIHINSNETHYQPVRNIRRKRKKIDDDVIEYMNYDIDSRLEEGFNIINSNQED